MKHPTNRKNDKKKKEDFIPAQHELSMKLNSISRLNEGLELCLDTAISISGLDCGGVYLVNDTSGDLNLVSHKGLPQAFLESASRFDAASKNAKLVKKGTPVYSQHHALNVVLDNTRKNENLKAIAVIPFKHQERVIGCLNLASHSLDDVPLFARQVLETVSSQIGSAVARMRAEEALRESEEKFKTIFENASDGLVYLDPSGNILHVNEKAANIYGCSKNDLEGKHFTRLDIFSNKNIPSLMKAFNNALSSARYKINLEITNREGQELHLECTSTLIKNDVPSGLLVIVRDVTERYKAEAERRLLEAQLQQAQKMEAIGTLAGGIAHDFNNLLMGVQGTTSLMLLDLEENHPNYKHLQNIEKYIKSAVDLTNQLLGFARKKKYKTQPTDINELIKNHNLMFGRTRKEIQIYSDFDDTLWMVEANSGQIEQVLMNLYVNAWHAMPDGGNIYVKSRNVVIDEHLGKMYSAKPGQYVKISVTDTGTGIDEKTQNRIFEPFFTTKSKDQGTGLGLATVYSITRNHGGFIQVQSELGKGTSFHVFLPATTKPQTPQIETGPVNGSKTERTSATVLVVDDEKMILDISSDMLDSLGFKVIKALGGNQAIDIYKQKSELIDIVLMDMIMPDMNGTQTFKKLKEFDPQVKVLFSSGYCLDGQAEEAMKNGAAGFIQKPFDILELSCKILEILN